MPSDLNFTREGYFPAESSTRLKPRAVQELTAVRARQLYNRSLRGALWSRLVARLLGRSARLGDLEEVERANHITGRFSAGLQIVPVSDIRGSSGRSADFDGHFHPLNENTRDRWLSIATAMLNGVSMPPVDLVKIGDAFYVRDGNHRVSVCRAMKQDFIDAEVTVWQMAEELGEVTSAHPAPPAFQPM